jgi:6-phosphogluconolactonase
MSSFTEPKKAMMDIRESPIWIYIGTETHKGSVETKSEGIYIYEMNPSTGALKYVATSPQIVNPTYIAIHPNRKWLYAVSETEKGKLCAFQIDHEKKKMYLINSVSSHGDNPCFISIDEAGEVVMTANYSSGTIAAYPIDKDGSLKEATSVLQHEGKGPHPRQEGPHAHMIRPNPYNRMIYAVDLGIDKVICYNLDPNSVSLIKNNEYNATPGAGPRHIDFHKNGKWAYIVTELTGTIEACNVDNNTGALTRFQNISTLQENETRYPGSADIHISPSGKFLYASNRGEINNIAMYSIDQENGTLTLIGHQSVKGRTPRNFVIAPSGKFLLVANQDSNNVVTFKIDATTGKLIDTGIETKVPGPMCLKFF